MHGKILQKKTTSLQKCGPQIGCPFYVSAHYVKTLKQLDFNRNNYYVQLTRWPRGNASDCGARDSKNDLYVCFFVLLLLCFYVLVQNTLFVMDLCSSFCNVYSFSIRYILQLLQPVIRVSRYRPSIFKKLCADKAISRLQLGSLFLSINDIGVFVSFNFNKHKMRALIVIIKEHYVL